MGVYAKACLINHGEINLIRLSNGCIDIFVVSHFFRSPSFLSVYICFM